MDVPWLELEVAFDRLVTLPPEERTTPLAELHESDPALYAQLVPMLASDEVIAHKTDLLDGFHVRVAARPTSEPIPAWIGPYEIVGVLGEGGMGRVYLAHHKDLDRDVALKVIRGEHARPEQREQLLAEARAMAHLHHPGIVPIYEIGEHDGQLYFTMAVVAGKSLADSVAEHPIPPRECAELMLQVAEALSYAHGQGVVHRDIKPGNILLDQQQTRVVDFGLAQRLTPEESLRCGTDEIVGTPSYMPPEQADGRIHPGVDVYSMGATLYHLLTGHPPFQAATIWQTLLQVREREPVPPRRANPQIPVDLETICLACLEKDPSRRYPSARALADDLARFLDDRPIERRATGPIGHLYRWSRRRWRMVVPIGLAVCAVLIALTIAAVSLQRQRSAEHERWLAGFVGVCGAQAQQLDATFRDVEHEVLALASSAQLLLMHGTPTGGKLFVAPGAEPPRDFGPSELYGGRWISTQHAITWRMPDARTAEPHDDLRRLEAIVPQMQASIWGPGPAPTPAKASAHRLIWTYIGLPTGMFFCYPGQVDFPESFDPSKRPWYRGAVAERGGIHWTPMYGDVGDQGLVLTCCRAFYKGDDLLGVAAVDVAPEKFSRMMAPTSPDVRATMLVDRDGAVRIRGGQRAGGKVDWQYLVEPEPLDLAFGEIASAIRAGARTGIFEVALDGERRLVCLTYLDTKDWYYVVVVERPR